MRVAETADASHSLGEQDIARGTCGTLIGVNTTQMEYYKQANHNTTNVNY